MVRSRGWWMLLLGGLLGVVWLGADPDGTWLALRAEAYAAYRAFYRAALRWETQQMEVLEGPHFTVYYTPADGETATWVLQSAEEIYEPVVQMLGYQPPLPVPVVVHPSRASLRAVFGWGNHQTATGVYWSGVIRILSPRDWLPADDPDTMVAVYRRLNPLAHELTHYILDYMARGHYPRWYTEGLAQWVEASVTGYRWLDPDAALAHGYYSRAQLETRFDQLANQAQAYRVSYLLVEFLLERCGQDGLRRLNVTLGREPSLDHAFETVCGIPAGRLEPEFQDWVAPQLPGLDAELKENP